MYHVTEAVAALFDSEQYQILRITGTDSGGNAISITAENVMVNGFNIDRYCCNSNRLEIGTAVSSELTLKLNNADGTFDAINFEGAELFVEIGIADWNMLGLNNWITQDGDYLVDSNGNRLLFNFEGPTCWIPCGYFTPDEQPRNQTIITLSALDRMMKLETGIDIRTVLFASQTDTAPSTLDHVSGYIAFAGSPGARMSSPTSRTWYFLAPYDMDVYAVPGLETLTAEPFSIGVFSGMPYGKDYLVGYVYSSGSAEHHLPTEDAPLHVEQGQYVTFSWRNHTTDPWELFQFLAPITVPITVADTVSWVSSRLRIAIATNVSALPNATLSIPAIPETQNPITCRDLIQWCAGLMGTNAYFDWNGQLRFAWYSDTGYTSTPDRRFSSDLYENDITVTGVTYTDAGQTTYLAGTDSYTLDLSNNALLSTLDATTIDVALQSINAVTHGFTYRPFEAKVFAAPWLFPMDRVTFTDKQGVTHLSALTNVNLTINGETSLKSSGETAQTNSYAASSGITAAQATVLRRVLQSSNEQIEAAVAEATSQITGAENSHVKFIYDENGGLSEILVMDTDDINTAVNVWRWNSGGLGHSSNGYNGSYSLAMTQSGSIVASMITTGILNASIIRAGIISDLSGNSTWNLETGEFVINQGDFSTSSTDSFGDIFTLRVAEGRMFLLENNVLAARLRVGDDGYLDIRSFGSTDVVDGVTQTYGGISNICEDANGNIVSAVEIEPNGNIAFTTTSGRDIILAQASSGQYAQYTTVRNDTFRSADGKNFIIRNGLLFSN